MYIKKVIIRKEVSEKIFRKHNIRNIEVEQTILDDNPYYLRARNNKYLCIGNKFRFITILFRNIDNNADVITAYKSSHWQIKLYKRKK